jgi:hypothetical protein
MQVTNDLLKEIEAFNDTYQLELNDMNENEREFIEEQLKETKGKLLKTNENLVEISSGKKKVEMLANVNAGNNSAQGESYLIKLQEIHSDLSSFWGKSDFKQKSETLTELETLWQRSLAFQKQINGLQNKIDSIESKQRKVIAEVLSEQQKEMSSISGEIAVLAERSEAAGTTAALGAFESLNQHIEDRMLGADLGIVKVYWIRKTDIEDEILRLKTEKVNKTNELDARFKLISSKLSQE